jgi:tetraether lipid synthase
VEHKGGGTVRASRDSDFSTDLPDELGALLVRFAVMNIEKIRSVLFQPIMFTGRDASVAEDDRRSRRYTFADLVDDLRRQMRGVQWEPMRDWFPMSAYSVVANLFDHLNPTAAVGSMFAEAHPSQSIFSLLLVNQHTRDVVPIASFLNVERLLADMFSSPTMARDAWIKARLPLAVLRNFDARRAPAGFGPADLAYLLEQFLPRFRSDAADWDAKDNMDPKWRLLMVAGMWFQDLFNFDFDVIGMDPARVGTVEGEISFRAHNSAGWRQVLEHVHKTSHRPAHRTRCDRTNRSKMAAVIGLIRSSP